MTRRVALTLCATIAVLAIPAIAQADYGDRCPASGSLTTIFGTDGPDSYLTGFVGTSGPDIMFASRATTSWGRSHRRQPL